MYGFAIRYEAIDGERFYWAGTEQGWIKDVLKAKHFLSVKAAEECWGYVLRDKSYLCCVRVHLTSELVHRMKLGDNTIEQT